jgi:NADPH2:quinone reductase
VRKERPFVPGQEVAGEVEAAGPGVTGFAPGDRLFGFASSGGLADHAIVPLSTAVKMPPEMSFADGACFTGSYATGYHALVQRARLVPGESLLVLAAAGGTGLAMVQLGAALGARVIAAASSDDKVALARAHGAERGLVYARDMGSEESKAFGAELKALEKRGIDIVADIVGGGYAEPAIRSLAWQGRFLVIGFPAGIPKIAANLLLLKGADAVGVFCGAFVEREPDQARRNLDALLALYVEGKIRPHVSATLPLERAGEGIAMLDRREVLGKLVVTLD